MDILTELQRVPSLLYVSTIVYKSGHSDGATTCPLTVVCIYHPLFLLPHALFKALLFMCAGGVIHFMGDSQDVRFIGGSSVCMSFTSSCLMVSNFALCGMPFLSGFYSRDFILEIISMR